MSRWGWAFAGVISILTAACADPVAEAQEKFDFLRNHGSLAEACAAGNELKAAAAQSKDRAKYSAAAIDAFGACLDEKAFMDHGYDPRHPEIEADNLEAEATR